MNRFLGLCALLAVGVAAWNYTHIAMPTVVFRPPVPPPWNETVGFCIGCTATERTQIYAGKVLPGDKPWRIEGVSITLGSDENPNYIGCSTVNKAK